MAANIFSKGIIDESNEGGQKLFVWREKHWIYVAAQGHRMNIITLFHACPGEHCKLEGLFHKRKMLTNHALAGLNTIAGASLVMHR